MSVEAPPRPRRTGRPAADAPLPTERAELEALVEALIEEARQRARRRRRRNGTIAAIAVLSGVAMLSLLGRSSPATLEAQDAASAGAIASGRPKGTIALTDFGRGQAHVYLWTLSGVRDSGIRGRAFGWSPDGTRLLVQRGSALYVERLDGRHSVLLTRHGSGFNAAWSPDGTRVIFEGIAPVPGHPAFRRILVVGADGRGLRLLPGWAVSGGFFSGNVAWAPDGSDLVFAGRTASDERRGLYRVAADGSATPRRIAIRAAVRSPAQLTWSPDGSRLAFSETGWSSIGDLFVMNPDGTDVRRIAVGGTGAVWSPDGSMLAFRTHGIGGTWVVRADGTQLKRLPAGGWAGLSWSPDSKYVAFAGGAGHGTNGDVFAVRPDGTGLTRILHRPGDSYGLPLWRHGTASTEAG